ncbi:MAG: UbiD family decarboxylase [Acidimicrobiia bacterium]|nr:UbiD family decarboxylase [Acidimicrobiia bacterium]
MPDQDLRSFLAEYGESHPDDVTTIEAPLSMAEDITAVVWELADRDRHELLRFTNVGDKGTTVVTNMFASRPRIEHMLGAPAGGLHERYEDLAAGAVAPEVLEDGPVLENLIRGEDLDLNALPLLTHFASDSGPYITSGIIVAEDPEMGRGNLSYHRAAVVSRTGLATSLHSRGDLWRMLRGAEARGEPLPVAMVIGAHPLFMLAASARVSVDERDIAGGLFEAPLEVVRTPAYGIRVPASAEYVLEGTIDPADDVAEGPFGEFSGYSSDRSTRDLIEVETILHRNNPLWVDIVGGNSNEHLNLARVPREAEMIRKLRERFATVRAVHYPNSGAHFHCYVAVEQQRAGEARQIMLALLGWDPYLKTVVAVDDDINLTDDSAVLWALATRFQPDRDVFVVDGLPGSPLDPSSSVDGSTARMALDATRGADFDAIPIEISDGAMERARALLDG